MTLDAPHARQLLDDVLAGLGSCPKTLPCKYFYDKRGSLLFDEICRQPEYYPTAAETSLLEEHVDTLVDVIGQGTLVELGSGSSHKTRILLDRASSLTRYVPVDISARHLDDTAEKLRVRYPHLEVTPLVLDYSRPLPDLGHLARDGRRTVVFFPGSSIGNFEPGAAVALLQGTARVAGAGGHVIVGVDVPKDRETLERAYDDPAGVTARFNRNLLERINREAGGDFEVARFAHRAEWQPDPSRMEMQLVSRRAERVTVGGRTFTLAPGEPIVTEHSYKWAPERFIAMAAKAGLRSEQVLFDADRRVSMHLLVVA